MKLKHTPLDGSATLRFAHGTLAHGNLFFFVRLIHRVVKFFHFFESQNPGAAYTRMRLIDGKICTIFDGICLLKSHNLGEHLVTRFSLYPSIVVILKQLSPSSFLV